MQAGHLNPFIDSFEFPYHNLAMTSEEMERAITFLIEHHAKVSADIENLTANVEVMRVEMREAVSNLILANDTMRVEIREGFENLIIANEVTRKLSEDVAKLAVQNSQRITKLEEKAS